MRPASGASDDGRDLNVPNTRRLPAAAAEAGHDESRMRVAGASRARPAPEHCQLPTGWLSVHRTTIVDDSGASPATGHSPVWGRVWRKKVVREGVMARLVDSQPSGPARQR